MKLIEVNGEILNSGPEYKSVPADEMALGLRIEARALIRALAERGIRLRKPGRRIDPLVDERHRGIERAGDA